MIGYHSIDWVTATQILLMPFWSVSLESKAIVLSKERFEMSVFGEIRGDRERWMSSFREELLIGDVNDIRKHVQRGIPEAVRTLRRGQRA